MKTTKKQRDQLYNSQIGYGWIVMKSMENEIVEIEVYVGRDNILRRVGNGKPLIPMEIWDEEKGEIVEVKSN